MRSAFVAFCIFTASVGCVLQSSGRAGDRRIEGNGSRQAVEQSREKESRTPAQQKIDSQLLQAIRQRRRRPATGGDLAGETPIRIDSAGRTRVDIRAKVTPRLLTRVRKLGGTVLASFAQYDTIDAVMPLDKLEALATLSDVKFIGPPPQAATGGAVLN